MAGARAEFSRAVGAHCEAIRLLASARDALDDADVAAALPPDPGRHLGSALRLRELAGRLAPDWLGAPWAELGSTRPPVGVGVGVGVGASVAAAGCVRIGSMEPVPRVRLPLLVDLPASGSLVFQPAADGAPPAVAGVPVDLMTGVLVRLLAAYPAGAVRILPVDAASLGAPFAPFRALVPAGVMSRPVGDLAGFRNVLAEAEEQVHRVQASGPDDVEMLLLACAALPPDCGRAEVGRLRALAAADPAARVRLLVAGPPPGPDSTGLPELPGAGPGRAHGRRVLIRSVAGAPVLEVDGVGCAEPDPAPPASLVEELCRRIAAVAESRGVLEFDDLVPSRLWQESSVDGMRTVVGRAGRADAELSLDDATPHWLVGGRTGSGKTTFLVDVLYGLSARYSPDELVLNLLDFKEGVSFAEFLPSGEDPSWLPHAQAVGIESDRQFGTAVLAGLVAEMNRRALVLKRAGVTKVSQLRHPGGTGGDTAMPRIVTVVDEFQVLFADRDETSRRATALLEEISRKGRSYGVHLILASQSLSGVDALLGKDRSIFGQFGVRVALAGGGEVLGDPDPVAGALPLGQAIVNESGGAPGAHRRVRFPDADPAQLAALRGRIWERRTPGSAPPTVFAGFAEHDPRDDPGFGRLAPAGGSGVPRWAPVGRAVEAGLPTVSARLDSAPGSHLAVLGTSAVAADVLAAATLGLARQHAPGRATFLLVDLVPEVSDVVAEVDAGLSAAGAHHEVLAPDRYGRELASLVATLGAPGHDMPDPTYVVVFGQDAAAAALRGLPAGGLRPPIDDLRALLRDGPSAGVHVLGWWRGVRRFVDDLGHAGKDDVSWLLALNVRGTDLSGLTGDYTLDWAPRRNRALLLDRDRDTARLIVPYTRRGRLGAEQA